MKRTLFVKASFIVLAAFTLPSCDDWLKATSSTQIAAQDLLGSRSGVQDALSGIYIDMGSIDGGYGGFWTWRENDLSAYPNNYMSTNAYSSWQKHTYTSSSAKSTIKKGWQGAYNVIANINFLMRGLNDNPGVMPEYEYRLVKGELYGLRAFIHFDLMRVFGVAEWNETNDEKMTVPYVTVYSGNATAQRNYKETVGMLKADIDSALAYLSADPVKGDVPKEFENNYNFEGYWNNRTKHFNYYAAKALCVRVLQWENDFEKAGEKAQELIDELLEKNVVKWTDPEKQRTESEEKNRDYTFSTEHIFSLEIMMLGSYTTGYIMAPAINDGIRLPESLVDDVLFPTVDPETQLLSGEEDLRGKWMMESTQKGYNCKKLYQPVDYHADYRNRMPVIKLSELFYIVAESLLKAGDPDGARATLDIVRKNRGITDELPETVDVTREFRKELHREFISEGQIFYWLKHSHLDYRLWEDFELAEKDLIYPYPDEETTYGRVQEL